jgi:hypothetical protein
MQQMPKEEGSRFPFEQETTGFIRKRHWSRLVLGFLGVIILILMAGWLFNMPHVACGCQGNPYPGAHATAQSFYQLLQQRDYPVAAQQLNEDATVAGQHVTTQLFVSQARETDTRRGSVQTFQIRDVQLQQYNDPSLMVITLAVTRSKQTYMVHMYLVGNGSNWKITNLDTL